VVGKTEAEERTVALRRFGSQAQSVMGLEAAVDSLSGEALAPDLKRA